MISSIHIHEASIVRHSDKDIAGLRVEMSIDDLTAEEDMITINFTYTALYDVDIAVLKIRGVLRLKEDARIAAQTALMWNTKKKLDTELAELILNTINYKASTDGTLVVRVVNLAPPMIPPKIALAGDEAKADEGAKTE